MHRCLIWDVFANRGRLQCPEKFVSRSDQVEAFDLPPFCLVPITSPTAAFNSTAVSSCDLEFNFTDNSTNVPQNWLWDFGDGSSSTLQNPSHTYAASGTYTVKLVVSNTVGSDSTTQIESIVLPAAPTVDKLNACSVTAYWRIGNGSIEWLDLWKSGVNGRYTELASAQRTSDLSPQGQCDRSSRPSRTVGQFDRWWWLPRNRLPRRVELHCCSGMRDPLGMGGCRWPRSALLYRGQRIQHQWSDAHRKWHCGSGHRDAGGWTST